MQKLSVLTKNPQKHNHTLNHKQNKQYSNNYQHMQQQQLLF